MMKKEYCIHRSMLLAVRKAVALYLINQNRENDILKIEKYFLKADQYQGNRLPIILIIDEVNYICSVLQDNHLGLNLHSLIDIESLPFYKALYDCIQPFSSIEKNELPFLLISKLVFRFFFLLTESVDLRISPKKNIIRFDLFPRDKELINKHQVDGVMTILYRILEDFYPKKLSGIRVAYRNSTYELEYYETFFGVAAEPSGVTSLMYNVECTHSYKQAASVLARCEEELGRSFFMNPLTNMLIDEANEITYKRKCEIVIETIMGLNTPDRKNVAAAMNISISTLQRKLRMEGETFKGILEDTRKRMAKEYLKDKGIAITDIAYLVGFKSHSQFFRIFKDWYEITPRQYRESIIR